MNKELGYCDRLPDFPHSEGEKACNGTWRPKVSDKWAEMDYAPLTAELKRAVAKHTWIRTPLNPGMRQGTYLKILVEEVGEVARAQTYDEGSMAKERQESLEVAAMAYARFTALDGLIKQREQQS